MYLTFDPSRGESLELILHTKQGTTVARRTVRLDDYHRSAILKATVDFFRSVGFTAGELEGVLVVNGCGRFTTLRLVAAVANTLAWLYHIPITGVTAATVPFLGRPKKGAFLRPVYSREPNITKAHRKVLAV